MTTAAKRLEGKVALITGAASGIGACTAKLFAKHGAKVIIADIQDQLGQEVCEAIGSSNSIYVHCDVTNEEDVKNAVDNAVATYGKLDIMFCNAGLSDIQKPSIIDNEKKDFERVLSINTTGVFLCMKHAARIMVAKRSGTILATSSATTAINGINTHAYCCSKHAVVGLTKNLAVELGKFGIRVNCLSPYVIATPFTKITGLEADVVEKIFSSASNLKGVTAKVDDIANAALFLVSDDARYISGHDLFVEGGFCIATPSTAFKFPEN